MNEISEMINKCTDLIIFLKGKAPNDKAIEELERLRHFLRYMRERES